MKRLVLVTVLTLGLAAFALSLLTGVTVVRPGERAVVRRFGRVLDDKPGPGLLLGLPWGMDKVDRVPVDLVRRVVVGYDPDAAPDDRRTPPGQLLTGDHNLVNVQVVLVYSIKEEEIEDYVLQAERVDGLLVRSAESALAEWAAARKVDDVLLHGKTTLPGWLVEKTRERIRPCRLGIHIRAEASVAILYPPQEVRDAFDRVTRAQTEVRTNMNMAQQEAERVVRTAQAERFGIEQMTAAHGREQRLLAEADAENFDKRRQQYQRLRRENPAYLAGIWWEEMGKLFALLQKTGRIDLLDNHLGADGLDITVFPPPPGKK